MSLSAIITPMNFDLVKASMATILYNEMQNQNTLLLADGKTAEEIDNNYFFNVYKDRYRLPDAAYLPAVNIRNHKGTFGVDSPNIMASKWHSYLLSIECYSISTAEPNEAADKLAADRLDYLWAQVFKTFESEENFHKGLRSIVRKARFLDWEQHKYDIKGSDTDTAEVILAIQAIYELQFEEPTEMITGDAFEKLVASLEIDEQFISPFVTIEK